MSLINTFIDNKIKLKNEKYSLIIGLTPSQGARSPKLWNKVYKKMSIKCKMYPADVTLKNLKNLIKALKKDKNFIGGSVTAPYKTKIIKYLDILDNKSKIIGSVNTIVKKKSKLIGYNTDFFGAYYTIKRISLKKNILFFGAGGAAKSVILVLANKFKNSNFYFYNRNKLKLKFLKKFFNNKKINIIKNISDIKSIKKIDFVVNTSSIGFNSWIKNKKYFNLKFFSPFININKLVSLNIKNTFLFKKKNYSIINKDKNVLNFFFKKNRKIVVFDIIYNPKKTKLLKFAQKYSNTIYNGLEMNLMQAVKGFSLVNNVKHLNKIRKKMYK